MSEYFKYGPTEIEYLKKADQTLAPIIDQIGMIKRTVIPDLFTALVYTIVGQQISTKAHKTVWERIKTKLNNVTPDNIDNLSLEELQKFGISFKKANYIKSLVQKIISGELDLNSLYSMPDEQVCSKLTKLDGIGIWTAEMLMIFSMQRPNVLSYGDLAIHRGLRMVYQLRKIDKKRFNIYWKRYTPYASVASLYLWAVACGAIDGMNDYETKKK